MVPAGRLPKEVYKDDALFIDPTQQTRGVEIWSRAVPALFDWKKCQVDLIDIGVKDPHHIEIRCTTRAVLCKNPAALENPHPCLHTQADMPPIQGQAFMLLDADASKLCALLTAG